MKESKYTIDELKALQELPLDEKIQITKTRIIEFYNYFDGNVHISFSGGKDSTVLKHIVDSIFDDVPSVFVNTGLEYPEIQRFVKQIKSGQYPEFSDNVEIIRPEMKFDNVIKEYGYPVGSKRIALNIEYGRKAKKRGDELKYQEYIHGLRHGKKDGQDYRYMAVPKQILPIVDTEIKISNKCCDIMKKRPLHEYQKQSGRKPILGVMAEESKQRTDGWMKTGCNILDSKEAKSKPISFWTEQDVLQYLKNTGIHYSEIYGNIIEDNNGKLITSKAQRTGCIFCMFGVHLDKKPNRFQRLKETHPNQYNYCMKSLEEGGLGLADVLQYIGVDYE